VDPTVPIDIALRVYAEPKKRSRHARRSEGPWRPSAVLFLDCETTTDEAQRLTFGFYRYCRIHWDGATPELRCAEEGILYADDLPGRDPRGFAVLQRFVEDHPAEVVAGVPTQLGLRSQDDFLYRVFYLAAYRKRAVVCGFNLPFDLSRLARHAGEARASRRRDDSAGDATFRGGFSFSYWGHSSDGTWHDRPSMPRVAIKSFDSKRALIGFKQPKGEAYFPGQFLDLRTLAFALTDESHSLETACGAFQVKHGKTKAERHGRITPSYVRYARRDVLATSELFVAAVTEYLTHPIDLPPTRALSPAAIGKAYLEAMGIPPILERQPDFPKEVLGAAMHAYFGGRAECRVRKQAVPVRYLDFRSMYPTVCALTGIWRLLTAERIEVRDGTAQVSALLRSLTVERCFDPSLWKDLVGFVEVEPDGDITPVRARYGAAGQNLQIGVNPLHSRARYWLTIPDACASIVLTGKPLKVTQAVRIVPRGRLRSLRPALLAGKVHIDPAREDFFRRLIEERMHVLGSPDIDDPERERLDRFLKTLANATSYGIFAELNRRDLPSRQTETVRVYLPDANFETETSAPEDSGRYFFPPIAATVTGAARLMLALFEREVIKAGGTYAFCDTDSLAIVASRKGHKRARIPELSWDEVERIRARFRRLSPYDPDTVKDLLKLEGQNFDKHGREQDLECYAISAKRYVLNVRDVGDEPQIVKASEHGLGHLLDPTGNEEDRKAWMREAWLWILRRELGLAARRPSWFRLPAVGELPVSSPHTLRPFAELNRERSYDQGIKPFNFVLAAHVRAFGHPSLVDPERFQLIASYERDPRKWLELPWIDRYSRKRFDITTSGRAGGLGVARVKSYGEVIEEFRTHREDKSLAPDGSLCGPETRGLLRRRPVFVREMKYIGKESNSLDGATSGLFHDEREVLATFDRPPDWRALIGRISTHELARRTGLNRSTIKRWKSGELRPRPAHERKLHLYLASLDSRKVRVDGAALGEAQLSTAVRNSRTRARANGARTLGRSAARR